MKIRRGIWRRPAAGIVRVLLVAGWCASATVAMAQGRASDSPVEPLSLRFVDVAPEAGVLMVNVCGEKTKDYVVESICGGACWFDYDADGDPDLFVPNGARRPDAGRSASTSDALFRNEGDGRFKEVTREAGVRNTDWSIGCAAADVDGDGWIDLYVTQFGPNRLYRNLGDGRFEEIGKQAGVADARLSVGAAFADADGDGDLDLYVAHYVDIEWLTARKRGCTFRGLHVYCGPLGLDAGRDAFYRNRGDGTFQNATREAGFAEVRPLYGLGVIWGDFDNDGDADLWVANDSVPNYLFINENGRFRESGTEAGVAFNGNGFEQAGMGLDLGDYENDGWFDLFVTNFSHDYSTLYRNERNGTFHDVTLRLGLGEPTLWTLGWGTRFADFDNDGWRDLFQANGHVFPETARSDIGTSYNQSNQIFINQAGRRFVERSAETGLAGLPARSWRGAAFADYDSDGDTDVFVVAIDDAPVLLRNDGGNRASWIGFELRGRPPNHQAIGARVTITASGRRQMDEVRAGGSYASQNDLRL
ncbi:MAG: CRTAC1 family protein, partial [Acidobacteriota bacterium]